ncbi:hypothetical protein J4423_01040 [Candidatus Pacearchaeota archaeon]|nr:hypothetical protein [Candidatus Pacearchaeota archaeon]
MDIPNDLPISVGEYGLAIFNHLNSRRDRNKYYMNVGATLVRSRILWSISTASIYEGRKFLWPKKVAEVRYEIPNFTPDPTKEKVMIKVNRSLITSETLERIVEQVRMNFKPGVSSNF